MMNKSACSASKNISNIFPHHTFSIRSTKLRYDYDVSSTKRAKNVKS